MRRARGLMRRARAVVREQMAVYVLVHGAWSGAHGFRKIRGPLPAVGHEVRSHGGNRERSCHGDLRRASVEQRGHARYA